VLLKARVGVLIAFILMTVSGVAYAAQQRPEYVPGEVIVAFDDDVDELFEDDAMTKVQGRLLKRFRRLRARHIKVPAGSAKRAIRILKGIKGVKYAELNTLRYLNVTPNDSQFSSLWGLNNTGQTGGAFNSDIDAPEAWNLFTGDPNMVVADIDTGLDMTHPDIAANVYTNPGEIAGNGIDDDGNGFIDDVHGWDFAHNDNDPSDSDTLCGGHGTHTAGTIGAVGNNGAGVSGVNWSVKIMPLKVFKVFFGTQCSATSTAIVNAINYAADMGVRVSNNSYGGAPFNQVEKDAIKASKSLFVAAAGNDGVDTDVTSHYPSSYRLPNIISVAATDSHDALAVFSNFGLTSVDLGAPGVGILSTLPGGTYGMMSGTSMAAPHVTGAAALLMAKDPALSVNEVRWRILNGADPTGLTVVTGGRLNINNSFIFPSPGPVTVAMTNLGAATVPLGGKISYSININNNDSAAHAVDASVVAVFPDGREVILAAKTLNVSAGGAPHANFAQTIPLNLPVGLYNIAGRVEVTGLSFDEDVIPFTFTP